MQFSEVTMWPSTLVFR